MLNPDTGQRRQFVGWDVMGSTCPVPDDNVVYIGKTLFSIMMLDSRNNRRWNITFYDYAASPMSKHTMTAYSMIFLC